MTQPDAMFIVGCLLVAAGIALWLLQRSEQRREAEREERTTCDPVAGHQQTQEMRRRWGL